MGTTATTAAVPDRTAARAARERLGGETDDLLFASHLLSRPDRHRLWVTTTVLVELATICRSGGESCGGGSCSACDGAEAGNPAAVCTAIIDHLLAGEPTGRPDLDGFAEMAGALSLPRAPLEKFVEASLAFEAIRRVPTWKRLLATVQTITDPLGDLAATVLDLPPTGDDPARRAWQAALWLRTRLDHLEDDLGAGRLWLPLDDLV
ncbi:MAG: hypothetical protein R3336_03320, partial [Phycisphaeraceae bacterium]|nr:hypothetical protein [Phycisphaeraceae bacterium]